MGYSGQIINTEQLLGKLEDADLNSTSDQEITLKSGKKKITRILVVNASGAISLAVGGIYDAVSKGGNPYVSAAQAYSALTAIKGLLLTLVEDYIELNSLYLSLTTAEGSALTCDIYVFGEIL